MGRGPVRPITFAEDGPRPGPTHQNFSGRAATLPSPSMFRFLRPGPARPINFSKVSARSITFSKLSARLHPASHKFQIGSVQPSPDKRPMTSPANNKTPAFNDFFPPLPAPSTFSHRRPPFQGIWRLFSLTFFLSLTDRPPLFPFFSWRSLSPS